MLVQNEYIVAIIESTDDEALIELANHLELVKVAFAEHLTQMIITEENILGVVVLK